MANVLTTATSGLLAFQRALDTTSHNISNVNTEGYSRQRVELATRTPDAYSTGFIGNGVRIDSVTRSYDSFLADQTRSSSSLLERLNVYANEADGLNKLFADSQTGLNVTLQRLMNAFQDVADMPSSLSARQVTLSQAQTVVDRLQAYDSRLATMSSDVNRQLQVAADAVSSLAASIAELNQRIELQSARTGQPPNDLLDQRDLLIDKLAAHVNVRVVTQENGQMIVSVGSGQPLIVGSQAMTVSAAPDPYDATRSIIQLSGPGASIDITSRLTGGSIGGLLDFQRLSLDPARNALGRMTVALAELINQQQAAGFDLNGAFGQPLLAIGGVQAFARDTNLGSAALTVTLTQPTSAGALTDANYLLDYTGGVWTLRRADTGVTVASNGAGAFTVDGMSIVTAGAAANGDSFLIRPTQGVIGGLTLTTQDPAKIAAAAPIVASTSLSNQGTGVITPGAVIDAANPQLLASTVIQFTSSTTYSINGAGSFAYAPGGNIDVNGWRVQISGAPALGDQFTVAQNLNPAGDNRNALLLAQTLNRPILGGGTVSIHDASSSFIGKIGVVANQMNVNRDAQQVVHRDNVGAMEALSGVNLDEEASNLLRMQQAYQAAAQMIAIAGTLFDSVLAAVRR